MTPKQKRRLLATSLILAGVAVAVALALTALSGNLNYLYSPSTLVDKGLQAGQRFRLGGVVLEDSIRRVEGLKVRFTVTDRVREREVAYEGILPDLFREGQSVIAHGELGADGVFVANKILAKHDETYMPAEVMEAMRKAQEARDPGPADSRDPGPGTRDRGGDTPAPDRTEASPDLSEATPDSEIDATTSTAPDSAPPGPGSRVPGGDTPAPDRTEASPDLSEATPDSEIDATTSTAPDSAPPGPGSRVPGPDSTSPGSTSPDE